MRTCRTYDLAVLADDKVELNEEESRDKYLDHAKKAEEIIEHKGDGDTTCNWCT